MTDENSFKPQELDKMEKDEVIDFFEKVKAASNQVNTTGTIQYGHGNLGYSYGTCPRCGYCSHCGRSGYFHYGYPYYPYSPSYPWTVTCGDVDNSFHQSGTGYQQQGSVPMNANTEPNTTFQSCDNDFQGFDFNAKQRSK
jgi:hypothetical protein